MFPFIKTVLLTLLLLWSVSVRADSREAPSDTLFFLSTICPGQSYFIAGMLFDAQNPTGTVLIPNASWDGTDSTVIVQLSIAPPVTSTVMASYCSNQAIFINGHIYDATNPTGTELLPGAATNGCDSLIIIDLSFYSPAHFLLNQTICSNDTVWVNNQPYDQYYYIGMETIEGGAANGCDSIIVVDLNVLPTPTDTSFYTICPGESLIINENTYNEGKLSGIETYPGAAANGCDSLVYVKLNIWPGLPVTDFLGNDRDVTVGDSICISMNPSLNLSPITWGNNTACPAPDCTEICFFPEIQQWVTASVTDTNGCIFSDSVLVRISTDPKIYIPNVFSPEAPEPNNAFNVFSGISSTRIKQMIIYDRWGSSVYEARDFAPGEPTKSWNGMAKGKMATPDNYTYMVEILFLNGKTEIRSGTVALVR